MSDQRVAAALRKCDGKRFEALLRESNGWVNDVSTGRYDSKWTPLGYILSAWSPSSPHYFSSIHLLLQRGADPQAPCALNEKSGFMYLPYHRAILNATPSVATLLLIYGANPDAPFMHNHKTGTFAELPRAAATICSALGKHRCYKAAVVLLTCRRRSLLLAQMPRDVLLIICRSIRATRGSSHWALEENKKVA